MKRFFGRSFSFPAFISVTAIALLLLPLPALAEARLTILSPHWEGVRYEFAEGFKNYWAQQTGRSIEITWLDVGATSEIVRYVESQFQRSPSGIGVDLVFGGGTDPFDEFERKNLLEPVPLPEDSLGALPEEIGGMPLRDPGNHWYAAALTAFGIICNGEVLRRIGAPYPQTWEDLTNPALSSWVSAADPRKSGSAHTAYEVILQAYGWEHGWRVLVALAGNVRSFTAHMGQIPKDVASGEVACGFCIDSYAWAQLRESPQAALRFIVPENLSVVNGDGIALLRGAPEAPLARAFIHFVLSKRGQRLWLYKKGVPGGPVRYDLQRLPVIPELYEHVAETSEVKLNPFRLSGGIRLDASRSSRRWNLLNDMIGAFLIDLQPQLRAARASLVHLPIPTEAEADRLLAVHKWDNPYFRSARIAEWTSATRLALSADRSPFFYLRYVPAALLCVLLIFPLMKRLLRRIGRIAMN